jgi:hypothetical protein
VIRKRGRARPDARKGARNPARGKAQGRIAPPAKRVPGKRTADGSEAQKSKPSHPRPSGFADLTFLHSRSVTPTKINRGGREARTARGPGPAEMPSEVSERRTRSFSRVARDARAKRATRSSTRMWDQTCEGNEPQERRRATNEGRPASPGQAAPARERVAERHAKKARIGE